MIKIGPNETVADLVGYSLKSLKPVPMYNGILTQINTLPAGTYSFPITGWIEVNNVIYFSFDNPASYPLSIYMPMKGGFWDGYKYLLQVTEPPKDTGFTFPDILPAAGFGVSGLLIGAVAAILILKR